MHIDPMLAVLRRLIIHVVCVLSLANVESAIPTEDCGSSRCHLQSPSAPAAAIAAIRTAP